MHSKYLEEVGGGGDRKKRGLVGWKLVHIKRKVADTDSKKLGL